VRQLLSESLLLSGCGAAAGWLLAQWLLAVVAKFSPEQVRRMGEIKLDAGVLVFTLALSVLTGLLFGLAPALSATKINLNEVLKNGARSVSAGGRQHRLRGALVVLEVALALLLLTGSGLLLKSFAKLRTAELGFNPDRLVTMSLRLPFSGYKDPAQRVSYFQQTLANLKNLPGVEAAGICFSLPMTGDGATDRVWIEGRRRRPKAKSRFCAAAACQPITSKRWAFCCAGAALSPKRKSGRAAQRSSSTRPLPGASFPAKARSANASRWVCWIRPIQPSSASPPITFSRASTT